MLRYVSSGNTTGQPRNRSPLLWDEHRTKAAANDTYSDFSMGILPMLTIHCAARKDPSFKDSADLDALSNITTSRFKLTVLYEYMYSDLWYSICTIQIIQLKIYLVF